MKVHSVQGRAEADLEKDELVLFNNVLNEVCNGFTIADFEAKVGATEEQVCGLFARIRTLETNRPVRVQLGPRDLLILQNALRETLRELGVEEFPIRVGLPFGFGQAALRELQVWNSR